MYSLAATAAGAATGAVLGLVGSVLARDVRVSVVSLAALALLALALWHLHSTRARMLQRDCETAQQWMDRGSVPWALRNGGALGAGFSSRIGFVGWYVVPIACFGFGHALAGAAIYGLYGATRGFGVWGWFLALNVVPGLTQPDLAERLFGWYAPARRADAAVLALVASVAIVVVGL